MGNYGYGKSYEALYLKAFETAKSGKPTLLFSCETEIFRLHKIMISHIQKIEMKKLNNPTDEVLEEIEKGKNSFIGVPLFIISGDKNIEFEDIEEEIRHFKQTENITDVVFDYVADEGKINEIASRLGVNVHY